MSRKLFLLLLGVALATACSETNKTGSSGVIDTPPLDLTGTWTGTWTSDEPATYGNGTVMIEFEQIEGVVSDTTGEQVAKVLSAELTPLTGQTCWVGIACPPPAMGDPADSKCTSLEVFFVEAFGTLILDVLTAPNPNSRLNVDLDILGNELNGTYVTAGHELPECRGDTGTITATRMDP